MGLNLRQGRQRRVARQPPPGRAKIAGMRAVLYSLLASSVVMIGAGLNTGTPGWLFAGCTVLVVTAWMKGRFEGNLRRLLEPALRARLQASFQRLRAPDQSLSVHNGGWLLPLITILGGFGLWFLHEPGNTAELATAAGVLLLAAVFLQRSLRRRGRPALVLSLMGIETPREGLIPWQRTQWIALDKVEIAGIRLSYELRLTVIPSKEPRRHETRVQRFWRRLLAPSRARVVRIDLHSCSEDPHVVANLAELLWRAALGSDGVAKAKYRHLFEDMGGEIIDGQAIARANYDAALAREEDLEIIRRAARAEPLDFDLSEESADASARTRAEK